MSNKPLLSQIGLIEQLITVFYLHTPLWHHFPPCQIQFVVQGTHTYTVLQVDHVGNVDWSISPWHDRQHTKEKDTASGLKIMGIRSTRDSGSLAKGLAPRQLSGKPTEHMHCTSCRVHLRMRIFAPSHARAHAQAVVESFCKENVVQKVSHASCTAVRIEPGLRTDYSYRDSSYWRLWWWKMRRDDGELLHKHPSRKHGIPSEPKRSRLSGDRSGRIWRLYSANHQFRLFKRPLLLSVQLLFSPLLHWPSQQQ